MLASREARPAGVLALTSTSLPTLNRLRNEWRDGRPTFGAIATIPSIQTVQIMARSDLDWIIIDLEHGPIDLGSAHAMIVAIRHAMRADGANCRQRAASRQSADGSRRTRH
jgi:hypothetical protein